MGAARIAHDEECLGISGKMGRAQVILVTSSAPRRSISIGVFPLHISSLVNQIKNQVIMHPRLKRNF